MSNVAALPDSISHSSCGTVLSFVVPAPDGCNLKCAFCFIDQRAEQTAFGSLGSYDYPRFVQEVRRAEQIDALCIQGHEPLLPASKPYTSAILDIGQRLEIPVSIVTNGTYLASAIDDLTMLRPARISVSIDADNAEAHDRQRRKRGAFDLTISGLKKAIRYLPVSTELAVVSVLMPKRRDQLIKIPMLLHDIGIKRWVVTALQKVGKDVSGGPVAQRRQICQDLVVLKRHADAYDIDFSVDDEFGTLTEADVNLDVVDINALRIRRLVMPGGIFRLMPDGRCSMGIDILKEVDDTAPIWLPGAMPANDFLNFMRSKTA